MIIICLVEFDSSCYGVIEDSLQVSIVDPFEVFVFCCFWEMLVWLMMEFK